MRHKRTGRKLGVVTKHRRSIFRNMATDLFRYDSLKTTDTRAKEIRRVAEKLITLAKKGTLQSRRQAATFIKDKDVLRKLFDEIAEKHKDRPGGYTRIVKLGFRKGDNAPISLIELVEEEYEPKSKKKKTTKTTKKATDTKAKSTKKESAEELGLIEEGTKATAAAEVVQEVKEELKDEAQVSEAKQEETTEDEVKRVDIEKGSGKEAPTETETELETKEEAPTAVTIEEAPHGEAEDKPEAEAFADVEESKQEDKQDHVEGSTETAETSEDMETTTEAKVGDFNESEVVDEAEPESEESNPEEDNKS